MKKINNAGVLFDTIINEFDLRNDRHLATKLGVSPTVISNIINGRKIIGASMILRVHETFCVPVARIRKLMGETA